MHATGAALPGSAEAPGYRLRSDTRTHGETDFRGIAADLRHRCEHETGWLGGSFPGDEAALTALCAAPDGAGWHWQTWHLYPDGDDARRDRRAHREPVATVSRNALFALSGSAGRTRRACC